MRLTLVKIFHILYTSNCCANECKQKHWKKCEWRGQHLRPHMRYSTSSAMRQSKQLDRSSPPRTEIGLTSATKDFGYSPLGWGTVSSWSPRPRNMLFAWTRTPTPAFDVQSWLEPNNLEPAPSEVHTHTQGQHVLDTKCKPWVQSGHASPDAPSRSLSHCHMCVHNLLCNRWLACGLVHELEQKLVHTSQSARGLGIPNAIPCAIYRM